MTKTSNTSNLNPKAKMTSILDEINKLDIASIKEHLADYISKISLVENADEIAEKAIQKMLVSDQNFHEEEAKLLAYKIATNIALDELKKKLIYRNRKLAVV